MKTLFYITLDLTELTSMIEYRVKIWQWDVMFQTSIKKCCFGIIEDVSEEFRDNNINFLTLILNSNNNFKFPSNEEKG